MPEPFIFITTHTVKDGRVKELERLTDDFLEFMKSHEPRVLSVSAYLDQTHNRFTLVQIHPDAKSMDAHLQLAGEKIHQAGEVVDNDTIEVYGDPGPMTRNLLGEIAAEGVHVTVNPTHVAAFHRLAGA